MFRLIVLIVVAVLVLSFFGISIRAIVESPTGHDNLMFLWQLVLNAGEFIKDTWHAFTEWLAEITRPIPFVR